MDATYQAMPYLARNDSGSSVEEDWRTPPAGMSPGYSQSTQMYSPPLQQTCLSIPPQPTSECTQPWLTVAQLEQNFELSTFMQIQQSPQPSWEDATISQILSTGTEPRQSTTSPPRQTLPDQPICYDHGCNGRRFSSFENYRRHIREKNPQKSVACSFCNASFTRKSNLTQHLSRNRCKVVQQMYNEALQGTGVQWYQ